MFNIVEVIKRAWHSLWRYRVLWVFGFFLSITALSSAGSYGSGYTFNRNDIINSARWQELREYHFEDLQQLWNQIPQEFLSNLITALLVALAVIVIGAVIAAVLRYVAEAAIIRMVDEYQGTGTQVGFRQGWKYGWSRRTWRLFVIDLIISIPVYVLLILLGLIGVWFYFAIAGGDESVILSSLIAGGGLAFILICLTVIIMGILNVVKVLAWRIAILEQVGAVESLRRSLALIKRNWQNVGLTWLTMIGIGIIWQLALLLLVFPLVLLCAIASVAGVIASAVPVLAATGIASLFTPFPWFWVIGGIVGLPVFFVVTLAPSYLVGGLTGVFSSSVWTLAYREITAAQQGG